MYPPFFSPGSTSAVPRTMAYQHLKGTAGFMSLCALLLVAVSAVGSIVLFPAISSAYGCLAYNYVTVPSLGSDHHFTGITAVPGTKDTWAAGWDTTDLSLTARWMASGGGTGRFQQIQSPPDGANVLYGISAVRETSIWAVGWTGDVSYAGSHSYVMNWDGSHWSNVAVPHVPYPPASDEILYGVSARAGTLAGTDVWSVGAVTPAGRAKYAIALVRSGGSWSLTYPPHPSGAPIGHALFGVSAVSSSDVWAVGYAYDSVSGMDRSLIEHWNGSWWGVVPSPNPPGVVGTYLRGVVALDGKTAWAVGYSPVSYSTNQALDVIEQWDGQAWRLVDSPSPGFYSELTAVAGTSATNVWAVGNTRDAAGTPTGGFALRWDGSRWSRVPAQPPEQYAQLQSVVTPDSSTAWVAGDWGSDAGQSLVGRYTFKPNCSVTPDK